MRNCSLREDVRSSLKETFTYHGCPRFPGNAFAAKIFLHEKVDRRRWIAAMLVAAGVALLAG